MKKQIDLDKAAEQEAFGTLAVGKIGGKHSGKVEKSGLTSAQERVFAGFLHRLIEIVKDAGARKESVRLGGVFVRLQEKGSEDILTIRGV